MTSLGVIIIRTRFNILVSSSSSSKSFIFTKLDATFTEYWVLLLKTRNLIFLIFLFILLSMSILMLSWCKKQTITWDLMTESSDAVVFLYKTRTLAHNRWNFTLCSLPFAALNFSKGFSICLWFVTLFEQFFVLSSRFFHDLSSL